MENIDWGSVLTIVFGALSLLGGGLYLRAKGKLGQLGKVAKEGYEAIQATVSAFEDDKLTKEEQAVIKKEALEAWTAIKILLGLK